MFTAITWTLAILSLAGTVLNVQKRPEGFYFWIVANVGWVLINWGANDSERSTKFAALRRERELGPFFADEYKLVFVNVGHGDRNLDVAKTYGAAIVPDSLPALTILDHAGKVLAQGSSRDLQSDADPAAFDPKKVSAFLTQYKAPAPDANAPFAAAIDQAKREGKSVFVWFSAPW